MKFQQSRDPKTGRTNTYMITKKGQILGPGIAPPAVQFTAFTERIKTRRQEQAAKIPKLGLRSPFWKK